MARMHEPLPIDAILRTPPIDAEAGGAIGASRDGRTLRGFRIGDGARRISLIGGCHADEPVGPWMLQRFVAWLLAHDPAGPWRRDRTWLIVPHANPDGDAVNRAWAEPAPPDDAGFDLRRYVDHRVREAPGDDVEFGFPRGDDDAGARPENRAIAAFLDGPPLKLHVTFHGTAFTGGPWFLIEPAWIERTDALRRTLADAVARLGYRLHDVERGGEKGFVRIGRGFCTRPNADAMRDHFLALDDPDTAARFRPSSMDWVRARGGDPLTLVSEMPLFLVDGMGETIVPADPIAIDFRDARLPAFAADRSAATLDAVEAMPIGDQMRLQLAMLDAGLAAVR